jgi:purine-binding chemotaxis protein CheW
MEQVKNKVAKNQTEEQQEALENIDFKMVTFSLAGKDYGIDIMKVKEIAKDTDFTYVPNTAPFVRGVYNLRGDIISIIDLRVMFNLPVEERPAGELENIIILRLDSGIIGVIVDSTDKVIGISSETIQPTHPLFGDINVKYISGVVENDNRLYIILDVERIFTTEEAMPAEQTRAFAGGPEPGAGAAEKPEAEASAAAKVQSEKETTALQLNFIKETLATFKKFYVTELNEQWVKARLTEWRKLRESQGRDIQLKSVEEANEFLRPFYSNYTGRLLGEEYINEIKSVLPQTEAKTVSAWNPGCGKGYESYSLAGILRDSFSESRIKIWANDNDLLSISSAPGLYFDITEVAPTLRKYLVEGNNGHQFSGEIKESILFEYHDILHQNPFPAVDVIMARDVLSFLQPQDQQKIVTEFEEKLKPNGIVIVGENEILAGAGWTRLESSGRVVAFQKETR